jgi:hypothetical protein
MQIQNKQASTPHHVHYTMQPPSKITVCKMYSFQYQPVKIINQKEWHMPPNILLLDERVMHLLKPAQNVPFF